MQNFLASLLLLFLFVPVASAKRKDANLPDLTIRRLLLVKESAELTTIDIRIGNEGRADVKTAFAVSVWVDGKPYTHTLFTADKAPLKQKKTFKATISNYAWLMTGRHTIKICADTFRTGKQDQNPLYNGYRNNMVHEQNENNNCDKIVLDDGEIR